MGFIEGIDPLPMRRDPKRRFRPTRATADASLGTSGAAGTRVIDATVRHGHGLKDPDIAIAQSSVPPLKVEAHLAEVERVIAEEIGR